VDRSPELPDLLLNVRPISQHGLFPIEDLKENRACWYAAAMMVLSYRGPLLPHDLLGLKTVARLWKNEGVQPHHLDRLADEAGLEHAPSRTLFARMGGAQWHAALSAFVPLMIVLNSWHMIVVRGVVKSGDSWQIVYNDPLTGASHTQVLLNFNGSVDWRMPVLFRRSIHRPPLVLQQPVTAPYSVTY
jgi:hypothetical protein